MTIISFGRGETVGPINYKVENYRVNSNDCLCGQVDKEEDYRSL